jgi:glucose-6-phosphate isomerase
MKFEFQHSQVSEKEISGNLLPILDRIHDQLKKGYIFSSEKNLPKDKRQPIDGFITEEGIPTFHSYKSDIGKIISSAEKIRSLKPSLRNLIIIGNGGSITSSKAFYNALSERCEPRACTFVGSKLYVIDSQEPTYIAKVKKTTHPDDSIVLPISKSGNTQGVLDALNPFMSWDYSTGSITTIGEKAGKLYPMISEYIRSRGDDPDELLIPHPPIGGRYTGRTPVGTLPLAILGMEEEDLRELDEGAKKMYSICGPKVPVETNPALKFASMLYKLDIEKGYSQIYAPMYSHGLSGFSALITQLLHESSCKNGMGQTLSAYVGPECQHHSNQRLFGGRKNMAAVFITVEKQQVSGLNSLDGLPLENALEFEFNGTYEDCKNHGIPSFHLELEELSPRECGALLAFSHYAFGVYPSLLRDVHPFDQPQVETSKEISRNIRKKHLSN